MDSDSSESWFSCFECTPNGIIFRIIPLSPQKENQEIVLPVDQADLHSFF
jgi:hypothetical protein